MKLKVFAAVLAVVGCATSVAVAQEPSRAAQPATVEVCHRADSLTRVVRVSRAHVEKHMRHGDLLPSRNGGCAASTTS